MSEAPPIKIAVCGVGLIGGSIGLAARDRLGAHVVGFDPDEATLKTALELGAIDEHADSTAAAATDADFVFCAAPVGALPDLLGEVIAVADSETVITDVGSTKRDLVTAIDDDRYIGGHPLAGAETSGVESSRPELFEGARWYLTPSSTASGSHYQRLQRLIADLGARPLAIEPEAHDRLMAHVSHLPHVLANVLVSEAAAGVESESERIPEIGPSFRDATRVAGANPGVWGDIYASNSDLVADAVARVATRLTEAAELIRSGDSAAIADWQASARDDRLRLLEARLVGGELCEVRIAVDNRPGVVAEIALALGGAGVNIEDMALAPAADQLSGAMTMWIAGAEQADRAAAVVEGLGHRPTVIRNERE